LGGLRDRISPRLALNPNYAYAHDNFGLALALEGQLDEAVAEGKRALGELTNNQAEYRALILGLRAVARYAPAAVRVCLDSELVVKQMAGEYRVKDEALRPLYAEASALVRALPDVTFTHVPRARNARADALANAALDEAARHAREAREART